MAKSKLGSPFKLIGPFLSLPIVSQRQRLIRCLRCNSCFFGAVVTDILEFKKKTTFGPTEAQLITAEDAIAGGNWPWEYQVNVFFRLTGSNVRRADLREFVAQNYPLDRNGNPIDCAAINVSLFTPVDRTVEGINLRLDRLDGDWELCLVLDYSLESEFVLDRPVLIDFADSLPEVQWQIYSGWIDVS